MFRRKESEEIRLLELEVSQREALIEKLQANYLRIDQEKTELEKTLVAKEKELEEARKIINEYMLLGDATPSDCKRGEWCRACEFAKPVMHSASIFGGIQHTYFCGKAESCKNFVQKEF